MECVCVGGAGEVEKNGTQITLPHNTSYPIVARIY